jgi:hypothetical protein
MNVAATTFRLRLSLKGLNGWYNELHEFTQSMLFAAPVFFLLVAIAIHFFDHEFTPMSAKALQEQHLSACEVEAVKNSLQNKEAVSRKDLQKIQAICMQMEAIK